MSDRTAFTDALAEYATSLKGFSLPRTNAREGDVLALYDAKQAECDRRAADERLTLQALGIAEKERDTKSAECDRLREALERITRATEEHLNDATLACSVCAATARAARRLLSPEGSAAT